MRSLFALPFLLAPVALDAAAAADTEHVYTQAVEVAESVTADEPRKDSQTASKPAPGADALQGGPAPQWIWGETADGGAWWLRKEFDAPDGIRAARLRASCDNVMTVYLNGKQVASGDNWEAPATVDVRKHLKAGKNELLVKAENQGGPAGFMLKLALMPRSGHPDYVVTDKQWQAARRRDASEWQAVKTLGKLGVQPWGDVFSQPQLASDPARGKFQTLPGFRVEKLFTVPKEELGSWVCITFDEKGRLIASDQGNGGLCRITPPPIGSGGETRVEKLDVKMSAAQGMLAAFGSLYCSVNGGPGSGFYRLSDTDGDDQYDQVKKLESFAGGGEHGPHAIRLAPDGKSLYVICGNHTDPVQFDASRVPSNWGEDLLLPRQWDARGHARGRLAPGGWIAQTDPAGEKWEIVSIGYRNAYDMDFNADGELFAYDADMEWDMGTSWYRPTRLTHATSGSEFGWRSGTGKWPDYYVDSLPPVIELGPGSPVGVTFGYGAKFPAKYQEALYLLDWTFGTIYAVHLTPDGATYSGEREEFLSRTPLPLTDAAVGPDGALYFTVGGRGTQSELYRVTYVGQESTAPVDPHNVQGKELRTLRHQLEAFHGGKEASDADLEFIWQNLGHGDRFIRYAARVALEHQDVSRWRDRVYREKDAETLITAAVALARQGDASIQPKLADALLGLEWESLSQFQKLELLRAWGLLFIRTGEPSAKLKQRVASRLEPHFPAGQTDLDRELARLLVYLNAPTVIAKTLELMERESESRPEDIAELLARNPGYGGTIAEILANQPDLDKVHYALVLRNMRYGWTLEQRKQYFEQLARLRERKGGASFQGFIDNIRTEALANASESERKALEGQVTLKPPALEDLPRAEGPGQDWSVDALAKLTADGLSGRNFEHGRKMFAAAQCVRCHRFDGEGGATGPDLTNAAGRFSARDLIEATVEPSKVVSDQYKAVKILTVGGQPYSGRILSEENGKVTVLTDPVDATKVVELKKGDIEILEPSDVSLMPKDLIDTLNEQEVLDLLAYILSRGNPNDAIYRSRR